MPIKITDWSPDEEDRLARAYVKYSSSKDKWDFISREVGRNPEACRSHWRLHGIRMITRLPESPYPVYDKPLVMEGDAVVLPDPEFPFHNADFINRVLDLSQSWGITQCIIGGDMLHLDSMSSWNPNWESQERHGGLDDKQEAAFIEFAKRLGSRQQEAAFALLDMLGKKGEDGDPNISEELSVSRKAIKALAECFEKVDVVLGNHEGRLLRQLNSPMFPTEITRLVDAQDWRIAPFYFEILISNGQKFIIEHPKSAAPITAERLSSKLQSHVIVCHSHMVRMSWDASGTYYAITTGCCVDESRLPYASQRHTNAPAHHLGATIVRDGFPYLLHEKIDWKRMEMMA